MFTRLRLVVLVLILIVLKSCAYHVTKTYDSASRSNYMGCKPYLTKKLDMKGLEVTYLGSMKLEDLGYTIKCREEVALNLLKKEACTLDADFINISSELYPDYSSSCYRCVGDFFKLSGDSITSKIIARGKRHKIYSDSTRKLDWSAFEETLPEISAVPYDIVLDLKLYYGLPNALGFYKDLVGQAVAYADISYVKESYKKDEHLDHINGLFDLGRIHAARLSGFLNTKDGRAARKGKPDTEGMIKTVMEDLVEERSRYEKETEFGLNEAAQREWLERISQGLKEISEQ